MIAAAVELKDRLPRVWARVQAGGLEAWRARRIGEATIELSPEAAAFVDGQVAPFAHRIGMAALERRPVEYAYPSTGLAMRAETSARTAIRAGG